MLTHPQLMARIEQYSFDNPEFSKPSFGFLDRLCVETGWTPNIAAGAIQEYRRFVYLAVTGERPVTPSREVDAVWHLHLTYTRSYWERLMPLLPRALHHEPTPGGPVAAATYRAQYADTKARYLAEFGETPPEDYWPPEDERFQPDMRKMRGGSDSASPGNGSGSNGLMIAGVAAAAAVAAAPAFAADAFSGEAIAAFFIGAGVLIALGGVALFTEMGTAKAQSNKKKKDQGDGGSVYVGGDGGSSSGGKGGGKGDGKDGGEGGEAGGEAGGDGGGGGCGGGCGS